MTDDNPDSGFLPPEPPPLQPVQAAVAPSAITRSLQRTQPWARLMGICGFVMVGLMMIISIGAGTVGLATGDTGSAVLMVIYPLMSLVYFFPSLLLVRYANRIRDFVAHGQQRHLEAALEAQRVFWKFVGILTVASFVISLVGVFAAVAIGVALAR